MSANRLNDLLPIPAGVSDPHAYQVFGLAGGEQDPAKIKNAVTAVYAKLKASKQEADPTIWKQAAKLAEKSKAILLDPEKRAELDARFGMVNVAPAQAHAIAPIGMAPTGAPPPSPGAVVDPLAGMLPPTNPMAAPVNPMAVPANPMAPVSAPSPVAPAQPVVPGHGVPVQPVHQQVPTQSVASATTPPAASASVMAKTPKLKVAKKRRKKSGVGKLLFVLGMCGLAAASAALGVFLYMGQNIPISKDGKILAQRSKDQRGPIVASARNIRPRDNVMGKMSGKKLSSSKNASSDTRSLTQTGLPANRFSSPQATSDDLIGMQSDTTGMDEKMPETQSPDMATTDPAMDMATTDPAMDMATTDPAMDMAATDPATEMAATDPAMTETEMQPVNPDGVLPVTPGKESVPVELTVEQIAANDAEIKQVKELIRSRNWEQMKPLAQKVSERTLSSTQATQAETLFNLADLALYYRGGLQRGLQSLKSTQTFDVTEGFRVSVVEATANSLSVKANGRIYRYGSIEEIKFRLGEKVASFAMDPDKPDTIASKAVYQAMSPLSNPEHLQDSIRQLEQIDSQMPDVDTKAIAQQIKELF